MTVAHQLACQTLNKSASSAKRYYDQRLRPKLLKLVINYWSTTRGIAVSIMLSGSDAISRTEGGVVLRVDDVKFIVQPVHSRQLKVLASGACNNLLQSICSLSVIRKNGDRFESPIFQQPVVFTLPYYWVLGMSWCSLLLWMPPLSTKIWKCWKTVIGQRLQKL